MAEQTYFKKKAAYRIALVSILLAAIIGPIAGFIAKESAEQAVVALATEESRRLLQHFDALELGRPLAGDKAHFAAETLAGGLFDIAEIYGPTGDKLAESVTREGNAIESSLAKHGRPSYTQASYESLDLPEGRWCLRVFVPLRGGDAQDITGFFEGVRIVPDWQRLEIRTAALKMALLASLAALLCGAAIYPLVVRLAIENDRKTIEVLDSHISMMEALGRAIAKRDSDTGAHNYRVAWIAARIAEAIGISGKEMQALIAGSFLHDVGKIGIPDAILLKPGRLDDAEMSIMRTHVDLGEEIVKGMGWLDGAHAVVAAHHEKWDGTGYPRQLSGEQIPLSARIFAIADVFDALSSKRPYKEAMPFDQVLRILREGAGRHFDPTLMHLFEAMVEEIRDQLQAGTESHARLLLQGIIRKHFAM